MLDNLNVEFEELDMEELQNQDGGARILASPAIVFSRPYPR